MRVSSPTRTTNVLPAVSTLIPQLKSWLKVGANMAYAHTNNNAMGADGSATAVNNPLAIATSIAPIYPMFVRDNSGQIVRNEQYNRPVYDYGDGKSTNFTRNWMSIANPIGNLTYDTYELLSDAIDANGMPHSLRLKD